MKKFFASFVTMLLLCAVSFAAKAQDYSVTITWDTPGSVRILTTYTDDSSAIDLAADATSITLTEKKVAYIKAAPGYILTSIENVTDGTTIAPSNNGNGAFYTVNEYTSNGKTFKAIVEKLETAGTFDFTIVNGAGKIAASLANAADNKLSTGTPVDCSAEGTQKVNISKYDTQLLISKNGVQNIYSVSKNGEAVSPLYGSYKVDIAANDKVEVTVYDPANVPTEVPVTVKFTNGDPKALKNIRNTTAAVFYYDLTATWTKNVTTGDQLQFNFQEDYTINSIKANGTEVSFDPEMGWARYTVTAATEIEIDATAKVYGDVSIQLYINGIEGLNFHKEYDSSSEAVTLTEVGALTAPVTVGGVTVPAGTMEYKAEGLNEREPYFFFSTKEGYYLATAVLSGEDPDYSTVTGTCINAENAPYYFDAQKIDMSATAVVYFQGKDAKFSFASHTPTGDIAQYEGQPLPSVGYPQGYTTIHFDPTYNDTFIGSGYGTVEENTFHVYADGQQITADNNDQYSGIKLHDGSVLKVFYQKPTVPEITVNFTVEEGAAAKVIYDEIVPVNDLTQALKVRGSTNFTITPEAGTTVELDGIAQTLTDGACTFTVAKLTAAIALKKAAAPAEPLIVNSTKPANGATVGKFTTAEVVFDLESIDWTMVGFDSARLEEILIGNDYASVPAVAVEPSEASEAGLPYTISFGLDEGLAEEGEYTILIPAGVFYQAAWDEANKSFVRAENARVNEAIEIHFAIDPSAAGEGGFSKYTITPANYAEVRNANKVTIIFPEIQQLSFTDSEEPATITVGETTYTANAGLDWNSGNMHTVSVEFLDEWDDPVQLPEGIAYFTLPAGLFQAGSEVNPEIKATFIIDYSAPLQVSWTADPENGSVQEMPAGKYQMVDLTFSGVESISYNPYDDMAAIRVTYAGTEISHVDDVQDGESGWSLYQNDDANYISFAFTTDNFKAPGKLEIVAEEGAFTFDGEASPEFEYSVTFGEVVEYTYEIAPANGETITDKAELRNIILSFPDAKTAELNPENYIVLQGASFIYPSEPVITEVAGAECPTFKIDFDVTDLELPFGHYSLTIGDGSFTLDGNQKSPEILVSWNLERTGAVNMDWKANPTNKLVNADGTLYVTFIFDELESARTAANFESQCLVKFNDQVIPMDYYPEEGAWYDAYGDSYNPNYILFTVGGLEAGETGKLSIDIPAGAVLVSGEAGPAISYTWDVVAPKEYKIVTTHADGSTVNQVDEVTIEFTNAETAVLNEAAGVNAVSLRASDYSSRATVEAIEAVADAEHPTFKVVLAEPITAAGKYVFSMSYGAFLLDGAQDTENFDVTFTVDPASGVFDAIAADADGKYTVVTISGVVLMQNVEAYELKNLPAGVYVINGAKVAIR